MSDEKKAGAEAPARGLNGRMLRLGDDENSQMADGICVAILHVFVTRLVVRRTQPNHRETFRIIFMVGLSFCPADHTRRSFESTRDKRIFNRFMRKVFLAVAIIPRLVESIRTACTRASLAHIFTLARPLCVFCKFIHAASPKRSGLSLARGMPVRRSVSMTRSIGMPSRSHRRTVDLLTPNRSPQASSVRFWSFRN